MRKKQFWTEVGNEISDETKDSLATTNVTKQFSLQHSIRRQYVSSPLHFPFTEKTKRSNTITNKPRGYVHVCDWKPQRHPLCRKKKLQLQLLHIKTVIKQKKLQVPENCRAKTFVLCGIAMGARLFISRQDRPSKESTAAKIDCTWQLVGTLNVFWQRIGPKTFL